MKSLVFDTGSIISLTLNNVVWLIEPLKERFKGNFYVTPEAKKELIERPLTMRRFEFEALQTMTYFKNNTLEVIFNKDIESLSYRLLELANHSYRSDGKYLTIVHKADMEGLAAAISIKAEAYVVDERTTRWLIEKPHTLKNMLSSRLSSKIEIDKKNLEEFRALAGNVKFLRSIELVYISYKLKMLDQFKPDTPNGDKLLLDGLLWGMKLKGCAISKDEIKEIEHMEK